MYVDGAKTLITASGHCRGVIGFLKRVVYQNCQWGGQFLREGRRYGTDSLCGFFAHRNSCLVARVREVLVTEYGGARKRGNQADITEGQLSIPELFFILFPSGVLMLLVGFVFLGRVAYYF